MIDSFFLILNLLIITCEILCPWITELNSVSFMVHHSQVYMITSVILNKTWY